MRSVQREVVLSGFLEADRLLIERIQLARRLDLSESLLSLLVIRHLRQQFRVAGLGRVKIAGFEAGIAVRQQLLLLAERLEPGPVPAQTGG